MPIVDILFYVVIAIIVIFVGHFIYLYVKKGASAAFAWLDAWWNKSKSAVSAIEADVSALKSRVTKLEGGNAAPAKPVAAPAPAPTVTLPATSATGAALTPASAVQQSPNSNG